MGRFLLNSSMAMTTMWIIGRFWGSFFEKKKTSFLSALTWSCYFLFQIFVNDHSGNLQSGFVVVNILLLITTVMSGYHCSGRKKYFLLLIFYAVWGMLEYLLFFFFRYFTLPQERVNVLGMVISNMIMIVFVYMVSVYRGKQKGEFRSDHIYLYLLFIPIGSVCIAACEVYTELRPLSPFSITSILMVFNIIILGLYIKMNQTFMRERDGIVHAQQLAIVSENTLEQKQIMEEFYREKHDLVNELASLRGCVEEGDRESAIRNLDKIIHNYRSADRISDSGNSTIDAILNFKYAAASGYGIDFCLKIFVPDELPIEQCDIGVVLGNAVDNAIEAVRACRNHKKIIEIAMGVKKEAWIVVIKNPYEHEIVRDRKGRILSTKEEKQRHGYGLKSIMRIAQEYQGEVVTDVGEEIFSLTIVLNFKTQLK